jgi:hypothetical protein
MNRRVRLLILVLVSCGAAAIRAAPLGDNTVRLAPSQLKLPQNIGPLRFNGVNRYSDRRLGRSYGYNASGISLSIYVYDYGIRNLPDGPDSVPLCEQYQAAKGEIERGGNYENVVFRGESSRSLRDAEGSPVAREAVYEFERHGVHAISVLWLVAFDGHFFKLRLSLRSELADELAEARTEILAAMADSIADSMANARAARRRDEPAGETAPVQEASIEVDSHYDAETSALWLSYALELVKYSREHPATRPPCGGRLMPGYAAELSARRAALAAYRARDSANRGVRYFDELLRIDAAGFLDEYAWHYLRNERWDITPPPGLDLTAFDAYRQGELASHVVQSGARVRINTVRVLPPPTVP